MLMLTLQSHQVLVLSPVTTFFQPQAFVHRLQSLVCFRFIIGRVLTKNLTDAGSQSECTVIIGSRMTHGATIIIQGVTRPNAAVSIIQTVIIRVKVTLLPFEMQLDDRQHLMQIILVGIIL